MRQVFLADGGHSAGKKGALLHCILSAEQVPGQGVLSMGLKCAPQTGMENPLLVQLPEMSSTSSTSSLRTALPTAVTEPKVIVLLRALKDDAAPHSNTVLWVTVSRQVAEVHYDTRVGA